MRERLDLSMDESEIEREIVDGVVARYARDGAPRIDGAVEAVRRIAADRPVAIASSAHADVIAASLAATGLTDVFEAVVSSDEVDHGKPAPDVYLEVARRLGVAPAHGAGRRGLAQRRAGRQAAGMTVVLVPNHSVPPAPGAAEAADSCSRGSPISIPDAIGA